MTDYSKLLDSDKSTTKAHARSPASGASKATARSPEVRSEGASPPPSPGARSLEGLRRVPEKRRTRRYSYDVWDDQIDRLKTLKSLINLNAPLGNRETSASSIVREAIDAYIEKQVNHLHEAD